MAFGEIDPRHHKFLLSVEFLKVYMQKNPKKTSKAFDFINRGKREQILLSYVVAIMMLYKNMEVKVCSSDGDTDYFDIVAGVLQGGTLAPYFFIISLDYMLRTSIDKIKDNSFKLAKERRGR